MSIFDETLTMNNGLKIPEMALGIWRFLMIKHLKQSKKESYVQLVPPSFEKEDLDNLMKNSSTKPAVNQILVYIGETPMNLIDYIQGNDIVVEAFSPIAHRAPLNDPKIKKIGNKYGVTVPQLCIRYDWKLNCVVLPKSANPAHMKSNAEIDFVISDEDMDKLKKFTPVDYGKAGVLPVFGGKM